MVDGGREKDEVEKEDKWSFYKGAVFGCANDIGGVRKMGLGREGRSSVEVKELIK